MSSDEKGAYTTMRISKELMGRLKRRGFSGQKVERIVEKLLEDAEGKHQKDREYYERERDWIQTLTLKGAKAEICNRVYEACLFYEQLEFTRKVDTNGHHLAQRVGRYAEQVMVEGWGEMETADDEPKDHDRACPCRRCREAEINGWEHPKGQGKGCGF